MNSASNQGGASLSCVTNTGLKVGRTVMGVNVTSDKVAAQCAELKAYEDHHLHRASRFQRLARKAAAWLEKHFVCGCGLDENYIRDLELEEAFQQEVTRVRVTPPLQTGVSMLAAYEAESAARLVEHSRSIESSVSSDEEIVVGNVSCPVADIVVPTAPVELYTEYALPRVSARVVGVVVSALDAKLGVSLPHTEANRAVVERRARLLMEQYNFRHADISLHLAHVVECYFQSREFLSMAGVRRRRAKAWVLDLLGFRHSRVERA